MIVCGFVSVLGDVVRVKKSITGASVRRFKRPAKDYRFGLLSDLSAIRLLSVTLEIA